MIPSKPGFYWYRVGEKPAYLAGQIWCIRVEEDDSTPNGDGPLFGWVPAMDYMDPMEPDFWPGDWLGEAIPPEGA